MHIGLYPITQEAKEGAYNYKCKKNSQETTMYFTSPNVANTSCPISRDQAKTLVILEKLEAGAIGNDLLRS